MAETYTVHQVFNGETKVLGKLSVQDGKITFPSRQDELSCDIFPPGKMTKRTKDRLVELLDNPHKSVYITRG